MRRKKQNTSDGTITRFVERDRDCQIEDIVRRNSRMYGRWEVPKNEEAGTIGVIQHRKSCRASARQTSTNNNRDADGFHVTSMVKPELISDLDRFFRKHIRNS